MVSTAFSDLMRPKTTVSTGAALSWPVDSVLGCTLTPVFSLSQAWFIQSYEMVPTKVFHAAKCPFLPNTLFLRRPLAFVVVTVVQLGKIAPQEQVQTCNHDGWRSKNRGSRRRPLKTRPPTDLWRPVCWEWTRRRCWTSKNGHCYRRAGRVYRGPQHGSPQRYHWGGRE